MFSPSQVWNVYNSNQVDCKICKNLLSKAVGCRISARRTRGIESPTETSIQNRRVRVDVVYLGIVRGHIDIHVVSRYYTGGFVNMYALTAYTAVESRCEMERAQTRA